MELLTALVLLALMAMNVAHFVRISERHAVDTHESNDYDY